MNSTPQPNNPGDNATPATPDAIAAYNEGYDNGLTVMQHLIRAALARLRARIAAIELNPLAAEEHAQRLRREDLQKAVDECGRELGVEVKE
jgi:hypothetical protein